MSDDVDVRDGGFDEWLDAIVSRDGYYLECEAGHGSLPPRRVCPHCGGSLSERPLPATGAVDSVTVVHVPTPSFEADAPYATALASFGPVRLTGIVRGVEPGDVAPGLTVGVTVEERETNGERLVVFRPV